MTAEVIPKADESDPKTQRLRERMDDGDLDQLMVEDPAAFERVLADRDAEDEQPEGEHVQ